MNLTEAKKLLESYSYSKESKSVWLDLGCGSGLFSKALAYSLSEGSEIIGIDQSISEADITIENGVKITFQSEEIDEDFTWKDKVDGIIMANFLHYIKDQQRFIHQLESLMKVKKRFLIVEYDREIPNNWVPYPISIKNLRMLFEQRGANIQLLGKRKSRFGSAMMYAAAINY